LNEGFFQQVYRIVSQIPKGKIATYGQIAVMLGRPAGGARVVGWAMRATPDGMKLPCHRVVSKSGALAPDYAFGGAQVQREMLEQEGVTFKADGRIDMNRHLWRPGGL
jgi:methylated-DNA-protein-cysteine methyltransferase-like protein